MNGICEKSLYEICRCRNRYHLPMGLVLYDGHCHVDLFFNHGLNQVDLNQQLLNGRKLVLIDNRHQYFRWFVNYPMEIPNTKIYTTFGIHPKYLPSNQQYVFDQLKDIFKNKLMSDNVVIGIGECGLDNTSAFSYDLQMISFRFQLKLADDFELPIVLHERGIESFGMMLNELKLYLKPNHHIHWHCVNPKSDLNIISEYLTYFTNGNIGLNCSIIAQHDIDLQNSFHSWLLRQDNILSRIIIETDFPYLKPNFLESKQYNPVSGVTLTAQHIVNVLRKKNVNSTIVIDISNNNVRRMYSIE